MQVASRAALGLARRGHLVLMQVHAGSADEAVRRVESWLGEDVKDALVGAVWQELNKGRAAYLFLEGVPKR